MWLRREGGWKYFWLLATTMCKCGWVHVGIYKLLPRIQVTCGGAWLIHLISISEDEQSQYKEALQHHRQRQEQIQGESGLFAKYTRCWVDEGVECHQDCFHLRSLWNHMGIGGRGNELSPSLFALLIKLKWTYNCPTTISNRANTPLTTTVCTATVHSHLCSDVKT